MPEKFHPGPDGQRISIKPLDRGARYQLQTAINEFAREIREAGYIESAHFMDIAALALEDPQRH